MSYADKKLNNALDNMSDLVLYGETQTDRGSENTIAIEADDGYNITIHEMGGHFGMGIWKWKADDEEVCVWQNDEGVALDEWYEPEELAEETVDMLVRKMQEYEDDRLGRSKTKDVKGEIEKYLEKFEEKKDKSDISEETYEAYQETCDMLYKLLNILENN